MTHGPLLTEGPGRTRRFNRTTQHVNSGLTRRTLYPPVSPDPDTDSPGTQTSWILSRTVSLLPRVYFLFLTTYPDDQVTLLWSCGTQVKSRH